MKITLSWYSRCLTLVTNDFPATYNEHFTVHLLRRPLPFPPSSSSRRNMELSSLNAACFFSTLSALRKCAIGPCNILFTIPLDNLSTASNSLSEKLSFWESFLVHFNSSSWRNMLARSWSWLMVGMAERDSRQPFQRLSLSPRSRSWQYRCHGHAFCNAMATYEFE